MAGLLVVGLICNSLVKPVHPKHHYKEAAAEVGGRPARAEA
jgi:hypothetical protein